MADSGPARRLPTARRGNPPNLSGSLSLVAIAAIIAFYLNPSITGCVPWRIDGKQPGFATEIRGSGRYVTDSIEFHSDKGVTCTFKAPEYANVRRAIFAGTNISVGCVRLSDRWMTAEIIVDGKPVLEKIQVAAYLQRENLIGYVAIAFCLVTAVFFLFRHRTALRKRA